MTLQKLKRLGCATGSTVRIGFLKRTIFRLGLLLTLTAFSFCAHAQLPEEFKAYDFGDIPDWAWDLQVVPYDSNAAAVILQDIGKVELDFGTDMFFFRHIRIKILKPEALDLADVHIPIYYKDYIERLMQVKGASYTLQGNGTLRKRKLNKRQTYRIRKDDEWEEQAFSLPQVQPGSIIEYRYTIKSQNIAFLETWDFQQDYPVLYSKISMRLADNLSYRSVMQGQRLAAKYDDRPRRFWELSKLPAIPEEALAPNPQDYVERLRFQLQSYRTASTTFPGALEWSSLMRDWEQLAWQLRQGPPWQQFLNGSGTLRDILREANPGAGLSGQEKANALYVFLQQKVRWTQRYNIFPEHSLREVWEQKRASGVELNLLYYRMLAESGIEAWPVLISTRSNGRLIEALPLLSAGNHVLVQLVADGDTLLADATAYDQPLGTLPQESLNGKGYRISNDYPGWVELEDKVDSGEDWEVEVHFDSLSLQPRYTVKLRQWGYPAFEQRQIAARNGLNMRPWQVLGRLGNKGIALSPPFRSDRKTATEDMLSFHFLLDAPAGTAQTVLLPGLSLLNPIEVNPFTATGRSLPIDFGYARHQHMRMTIHIPQGWQAVDVLHSTTKVLPLRYGTFRYESRTEGNKVIIDSQWQVEQRIPSRYYDALRDFYTQFLQVQDRPLLLKKDEN